MRAASAPGSSEQNTHEPHPAACMDRFTCRVIDKTTGAPNDEAVRTRANRKVTTMDDVIARYLDCWNETDPAARRILIDEVWAPGAAYTDPLAQVKGRAEIDGAIAAVQDQFPGCVFTLAGPIDAHHQQARFTWALGSDGAEPLVVGFDVAVTDEAGRITTVLGFLDKVPA